MDTIPNYILLVTKHILILTSSSILTIGFAYVAYVVQYWAVARNINL